MLLWIRRWRTRSKGFLKRLGQWEHNNHRTVSSIRYLTKYCLKKEHVYYKNTCVHERITYKGVDGFARSTRVVHMVRSIILSPSALRTSSKLNYLLILMQYKTQSTSESPGAEERGKPLRSSAFCRISSLSLSDRMDGPSCFFCLSSMMESFMEKNTLKVIEF